MRRAIFLFVFGFVPLALSACGGSRIPARLDPDNAYQRQVISLRTPFGSPVDKVVWDADTPYERVIDISHSYFQIPEDAWPGPHRVRLVPEIKGRFTFVNLDPGEILTLPEGQTMTNIRTVRVSSGEKQAPPVEVDTTPDENVWLIYVKSLPRDDGKQVFPPPRVEDIAVPFIFNVRNQKLGGSFLGGVKTGPTLVDAFVTVSAANLDPDATIEVWSSDGSYPRRDAAARFLSALPVEYMVHHKPETFGYPIYHYAQLAFTAKDLEPGSVYNIAVKNRDGQLADWRTFSIPIYPALKDSDNDGYLDSDEKELASQGYDVNPFRKDIIVEVDWMEYRKPDDGMWPIVEQTFANAPVLNPDGSSGINIIIDRGQDRGRGGPLKHGGDVVPLYLFLQLTGCTGDPLTESLKMVLLYQLDLCRSFEHFSRFMNSPALTRGGHYALFGAAQLGGSSGRAFIGGRAFIVTLWGFGDGDGATGQAGTFVHELGHNLGLGHGGHGGEKNPFKPNFPSTMGYRWQIWGPDLDCNMTRDGTPTYSQGMRAPFNEATMSEADGVCDDKPADIDWSKGDPVTVAPTSANGPNACDPNKDSYCDTDTNDVFTDSNQWLWVQNQVGNRTGLGSLCMNNRCEPW